MPSRGAFRCVCPGAAASDVDSRMGPLLPAVYCGS